MNDTIVIELLEDGGHVAEGWWIKLRLEARLLVLSFLLITDARCACGYGRLTGHNSLRVKASMEERGIAQA